MNGRKLVSRRPLVVALAALTLLAVGAMAAWRV